MPQPFQRLHPHPAGATVPQFTAINDSHHFQVALTALAIMFLV
jgi:hypothetical protein